VEAPLFNEHSCLNFASLCRPVQRLRMKDERGFALIIALLVLALVAVVSAEFA